MKQIHAFEVMQNYHAGSINCSVECIHWGTLLSMNTLKTLGSFEKCLCLYLDTFLEIITSHSIYPLERTQDFLVF